MPYRLNCCIGDSCSASISGVLACAIGLIIQIGLILFAPPITDIAGDQGDYVNKATNLRRFGTFFDNSSGTARSTLWSDFRPPGYSVYLWLWGVTDENHSLRRPVIAVVQIILLVPVLLYTVRETCRNVSSRFLQSILGCGIGFLAPLFEHQLSLLPDQLAALLTVYGIVFYAQFITVNSQKWAGVFAVTGTAILGLTCTVRPDLILTAPFLFPICIVVRKFLSRRSPSLGINWRVWLLVSTCCGTVFLAFVGANIWYRYACFGELRIYGRLAVPAPGAEAWGRTWINTEKSCLEQFLWPLGMPKPALSIDQFPSRAFREISEHRAVDDLLTEINRSQVYTTSIDRRFQRLADKKVRDNPVSCFIVPRTWRVIHLWLNLESNWQSLIAVARLDRPIRRGLLLALVVVKWTVVVGALSAVVPLLGAFCERKVTNLDVLASLTLLTVLFRSFVIGFAFGSHEHRYATAVWPCCAIAGSYGIAWWSLKLSRNVSSWRLIHSDRVNYENQITERNDH